MPRTKLHRLVEQQPESPAPDLEALLAERLTDELIEQVDFTRLSKAVIASVGRHFFDWLVHGAAPPSALPMSEVEAIAGSEDIAA